MPPYSANIIRLSSLGTTKQSISFFQLNAHEPTHNTHTHTHSRNEDSRRAHRFRGAVARTAGLTRFLRFFRVRVYICIYVCVSVRFRAVRAAPKRFWSARARCFLLFSAVKERGHYRCFHFFLDRYVSPFNYKCSVITITPRRFVVCV